MAEGKIQGGQHEPYFVRLFGLGMILFVSTPALAQNFHNQLVSNTGDPRMIPHAVQMGYDYTQQPGARSAGLKQIIYLSANRVPLRLGGDGAFYPHDETMTQAQIAEYDRYACIRDPNTNDAAFRYYIEWVNPGDTQWISSQLMFYVNYQSKAAMDAVIAFYQTHLDWGNIDGVMLDQVEYDFNYYLINASYEFASRYPGGVITTCNNAGDKDFSMTEGFTYYVRALRDMFNSHNVKVAANVYDVSGWGQTVHSTFSLDHYYNESGVNNEASTFGIVPPNMVTILIPSSKTYSDPYPYSASYDETLRIAEIAALQGSWYGAFSVVDFVWITTSGMNAIQLLHAMPNWDNLVNATNRSWNGSAYASSNSYADSNIVYSRHPKTGKLFVVFRSETAVLPFRVSETVVSVHCADDIFIEREDCAGHFAVNESEVRLTEAALLDQGYILEVR